MLNAGVRCSSSEVDSAVKEKAAKLGWPATTKGHDTRAIAKSNTLQAVNKYQTVLNFMLNHNLQWLSEMCAKVSSLGIFEEKMQPNHVLINEYTPGQGIMVST